MFISCPPSLSLEKPQVNVPYLLVLASKRLWAIKHSIKKQKRSIRYMVDGETGRNLKTRLTEHKWATKNGDIRNHISEHHQLTKHKIDWDSAEGVTYCTAQTTCRQQLTLVSWHTNSEQEPLKGHQQLPALYKRLTHNLKWNEQIIDGSKIIETTDQSLQLSCFDDQCQLIIIIITIVIYYHCIILTVSVDSRA